MKIYLTLLSTDNYLPYVFTLYQSYLHTNSKYSFYVGTGKLVSQNTKQILKKRNIPFIEVSFKYSMLTCWDNINKINGKNNWNYVWDKIEFFNLIQFEQICCLDSDMIILKNIDEIFENKDKNFYASVRYPNKNYCINFNENFHCGCLLFKPNKEIYKQLYNNFIKNKEKYKNEAFLLWDTFKDFEYLPYKYNVLSYWWTINTIQKDFKKDDITEINIFHFDEIKPLTLTFENYVNLDKMIKPFFDKWYELYDEWHGKE